MKSLNIYFHFLFQKNIFTVILNKNKNIVFPSYQSYDLLNDSAFQYLTFTCPAICS